MNSWKNEVRNLESWIVQVACDRQVMATENFNENDTLVVLIDGLKCSSKEECLARMSTALRFPSYFGSNWDALEECLCDLEWLDKSGLMVVFQDADLMLRTQESDWSILLRILRNAASYWMKQRSTTGHLKQRSFRVVFQSEPPKTDSLRDRLTRAGFSEVPLLDCSDRETNPEGDI